MFWSNGTSGNDGAYNPEALTNDYLVCRIQKDKRTDELSIICDFKLALRRKNDTIRTNPPHPESLLEKCESNGNTEQSVKNFSMELNQFPQRGSSSSNKNYTFTTHSFI